MYFGYFLLFCQMMHIFPQNPFYSGIERILRKSWGHKQRFLAVRPAFGRIVRS